MSFAEQPCDVVSMSTNVPFNFVHMYYGQIVESFEKKFMSKSPDNCHLEATEHMSFSMCAHILVVENRVECNF